MTPSSSTHRQQRRGTVAAHALAAILAVADARALELPAWAAIAGVGLTLLHLLSSLAIGRLAGLVVSAVPVLLGIALLLVRASGEGCDPCTGGWRDVPLGIAMTLTFVFLVDIGAGPLWGARRRRSLGETGDQS